MPSNHTLFVCADKTFTLAHSYFYEKVSTFTCEFCTCVIKRKLRYNSVKSLTTFSKNYHRYIFGVYDLLCIYNIVTRSKSKCFYCGHDR